VKLDECRKAYDTYSSTASSICRQLGFAGIAIIWLFKTDQAGKYVVPSELTFPGFLLIAALTADFLHYIVCSSMWSGFGRWKELRGATPTDEFFAPRWINWPGNFFFWTKLALMLAAYLLMLSFLFGRVVFT
jgi:hypothetical protein